MPYDQSELDNPFSPVTEYVLHAAWKYLFKHSLVEASDAERVYDGSLTSGSIIELVDLYHPGGWHGFLNEISPEEIWSLFSERRDSRGRIVGVTEKSNFGNTRYRQVSS